MVKNISKDRRGVMDVLMTVHVTMPVEDYTVVTISKLKTLQISDRNTQEWTIQRHRQHWVQKIQNKHK